MENKLRNTIIKNIIIEINSIFDKEKTSTMAIELLSTINIAVVFHQQDDIELKDSKHLSAYQLANVIHANLNEKESLLTFTIIYNDKKHLKHLNRVVIKHPEFFSFLYLTKIIGTALLKYSAQEEALMFNVISDREYPFLLIESAINFELNAIVHTMLYKTSKKSTLVAMKDIFPQYKDTNNIILTSALTILADMKLTANKLIIKKHKGKFLKISTYNLNYVTTSAIVEKNRGIFIGAASIAKQDASYVTLSNQLISNISTNCKGTDIGDLLNIAFNPIAQKVNWWKKLKKSIVSTIDNKIGNDEQLWVGINNIYRHIYKSPITLADTKKLKIIISIDNSSSISMNDLQNIYGLFLKKGKSISDITVMFHTTAVSRIFTMHHDTNITLHPKFKEAFGVRHADGGTSHNEVFYKISKLIHKNKFDLSKYIYISFSDNYSDIEFVISKYPKMKKITTFYLRPINGSREINTAITGGVNLILG